MSGNSSRFAGRIGGLAVALGVGTAIFTFAGTAWAAPSSTDSSGAAGSPSSAAASDNGLTTDASRLGGQRSRGTSAGIPGAHRVASTPSPLSASRTTPTASTRHRSSLQPALPAASSARPRTAATTTALPPASTSQRSLDTPRSVIGTLAGGSPLAPSVDSPAARGLLGAARRPPSGAAVSADAQTAATVRPTLVLNGYAVVAATSLNVTSYYGKYSTGPSSAGSVQGRQEFDLVDQQTGEIVGKFDALVSQNNSFGLLGHRRIHTELLVTDVREGTVGTGPGEVPPLFSRIGTGAIGDSAFGSVYSAMPQLGSAVVKWTVLTPFGNIPFPNFLNVTQGFADDGEVNQPFDLGNGYSIGPANRENPWLRTAIAGISPIYTVEQGTQEFRVYDTATGVTTGTFRGFATPTQDALGAHTLAILVTDTEGSTNVGTDPGQTPPPDTVYNVLYYRNLSPYILYSSMPSASGDVISTQLITPRGSLRLPFRFNASTPPTPASLQVPGGYTFVPTSSLYRTGLNGLPPLEMLEQGYQQFDVLDSAGNKIGSVDADVSHQWNGAEPRALSSVQNTGMLITKVTAGTSGTGTGDVPPPGSVFNFLQSRVPGFNQFYSAIQSPTGNVITNLLITPFGSIRIPTSYDAAAGLADVTYVNTLVP